MLIHPHPIFAGTRLSIRCHMLKGSRLLRAACLLLLLLLYCEWLHYFVVLLQCTWPLLKHSPVGGWVFSQVDLKVMFISDIHLLGTREGHWFDKVRREWQMHRSFQTSMLLHQPDVVFILGDLLDEGKWCTDEEFQDHVDRFNNLFQVSGNTQRHLIVGNHDIGYHYMITAHKQKRFEEAFDSKSAALLNIKGINFVLLNSMAMEGDNCDLCLETQTALKKISKQLNCAKGQIRTTGENIDCHNHNTFPYSRPVLLQHFPMYRMSDENCSTEDAAPPEERNIPFRPRHDTLSKSATDMLFKLLEPRLVIGGHIHHGCFYIHENGVPEWTVASFSWRNKRNPSFLMTRISGDDFAVHQCHIPDEWTVVFIYISGGFFIACSICLPWRNNKLRKVN